MSATLDTEKADVLTGLPGKKVIIKALGTADPAEAKRLHVAL